LYDGEGDDHREAETLLTRAISLPGCDGWAYVIFADLCYDEGRDAESERYARLAVQQEPEHSATHAALGRVCSRMGRADEAEREFRYAVALDPWYPDHVYRLAWFLWEQRRQDEARECIIKVLQLDPAYPVDETILRDLDMVNTEAEDTDKSKP
jgi:tetratricopeptide (TPR) repeat protein